MPRIPSSDRRALLVQAAIRVIARHGVAGATTRAIVAEADMSLASFHYAFRSHSEMMREVVAFVVDAEVASAFASLRLGSDIRQALRDGLQAFLDYVIADPGHEQVMQELAHYALRTPGLERLAAEQYEAYRAGVMSVLAEGAAVSAVEWTLPVRDVARLVVTITDGVTLAWLADRDTAAAERVLDFAADSLASLAVPVRRRESSREDTRESTR
jgi:AcrR family transcriptional regulator